MEDQIDMVIEANNLEANERCTYAWACELEGVIQFDSIRAEPCDVKCYVTESYLCQKKNCMPATGRDWSDYEADGFKIVRVKIDNLGY